MSNKNASLPSDSEKREIARRLIAEVKTDNGEFAVSPEILKAIARCQEEFKSSELWALTDLDGGNPFAKLKNESTVPIKLLTPGGDEILGYLTRANRLNPKPSENDQASKNETGSFSLSASGKTKPEDTFDSFLDNSSDSELLGRQHGERIELVTDSPIDARVVGVAATGSDGQLVDEEPCRQTGGHRFAITSNSTNAELLGECNQTFVRVIRPKKKRDCSKAVDQYSGLTDEELAFRVSESAEEVWFEMYSRFYVQLLRVFKNKGLAESDAEDLVQEVMINVLIKIHLYKSSKLPFEIWVMTIAKNLAIDFFRKSRTQIRGGGNVIPLSTLAKHDDGFAPQFASNSTTPDSACANKEIVELLENELKSRDWATLKDHFLNGLSFEEIAPKEGVTDSAIRKRLDKAKERAAAVLRLSDLYFIPSDDFKTESV